MRPLQSGVSDADLAAVARIRRRIASDDGIPLPSKRKLLADCDELHSGVRKVITERTLNKGTQVNTRKTASGSKGKRNKAPTGQPAAT